LDDNLHLHKDLRAISADGAACSLMMGMGETYFPAFVLAVSQSQLACGLTATVPMVAGAGLQLVTPWAIRRIGSYRRWVVLCALLQAAAFAPLLAAAVCGMMPVWLAFAVIAVYWATSLGGGSAWNAWVGTLVPAEIRASYFARRTMLSQAGLLAGIIGGGVALQVGAQGGWLGPAFALVFAAAAGSRLISGCFLSRQSEPLSPQNDLPPMALGPMWRSLWAGRTGRLLVYLFAVQAAVQISGPYFTPYMLRQLEFSYGTYVALIAIAYVAKIVTLPAWGWIAGRLGVQRLLWIGGLAIVPISGLWAVSSQFSYLCVAQVLSGIAWAAYELAMLLLIFETIPRASRVSMMTMYNMANSLAILLGSLVGGALLSLLGETGQAYWLLFVVSSFSRAAALVLLGRASGLRSGGSARPHQLTA
jgi:MFS family permease